MAESNKKLQLIPSINLQENDTISDAFRAINGQFGMVATILDEESHLSGVVSEGDLRRAMLRGSVLSTLLGKVMNRHPVIFRLDDLGDESKRNKIIKEIGRCYDTGQVLQAAIPIIDADGKVAGLAIPEMLQAREWHSMMSIGRKSGNPHVLVVGGAGYIGSVLVRMLLAENWRVRVLDNMLYRQTSLDGINNRHLSVMRGDVTNINDVVRAIEDIDVVVYLAEIVGDAACAYKPGRALKTNYLAVANMAHLCAYLNINRFVYASSCSVYGGSKDPDRCLFEKSEPNPVSYYGRMKIAAEQALLNISNPFFAPTILRLATVFGYSYRPRFDLVVNTFAKNAFFNKHIEVFGGDQWRPNVHVSDVAKAIIKTLDAPIQKVSRETFNVGSTEGNHTINQLAEAAVKVFCGARLERKKNLSDSRNYRIDFSKMEDILGYRAKITVLDGLEELKAVFKKGEIKEAEDLRYSNIKALKEIDSN